MERIEHWVGLYVVWGVGLGTVITGVGVLIYFAGVVSSVFVEVGLQKLGMWRAWLQLNRTLPSWRPWAAERCRTGLSDKGYPMDERQLSGLRKFFKSVDPDNVHNWRPEPADDDAKGVTT